MKFKRFAKVVIKCNEGVTPSGVHFCEEDLQRDSYIETFVDGFYEVVCIKDGSGSNVFRLKEEDFEVIKEESEIKGMVQEYDYPKDIVEDVSWERKIIEKLIDKI